MARSKKSIKDALLDGMEVVTQNAYCKAFGGTHRYWIVTDDEGVKHVRCFGQGPNWQDQDDRLVHDEDIDRHVDSIYRDGNAKFCPRHGSD